MVVEISEIENRLRALPEDQLEAVLAFIELLSDRDVPNGLETAIASERVLAHDWLRPEEDEAWADL